MKLLLISNSPDDKTVGASRVYHFLAEMLEEMGHEVKLLHLEDMRVPAFLRYFSRRIALPEFVWWYFSAEARKPYDAILCSNGAAYRIFRQLRKQPLRPRLVHHIHGLSLFDFQATTTEKLRGHTRPGRLFMALKRRLVTCWDARGARAADVIIAQCLRDADYLENHRTPPGSPAIHAPVEVIPAALHPQIAQASAFAVPPEDRNPMSILWFGAWRPRKGHFYVARAFREVKKKHPAATLTLGGTLSESQSILAAFDLDLRSSIRILPRISTEEQIREFNAHSIFIFPSLSEGFGLALIEAMAMGMAAVTTHTGVASDWMEDGRHALLVAMASSEHLARGILRLIEDDELRCRVAREGQALARTFTVERQVAAYLRVFDGVVKDRGVIPVAKTVNVASL